MPQSLAAFLLPSLIQGLGAIGIPIATIAALSPVLALGASYLLLGGAALLASTIFSGQRPDAPKPEDGKYNLKQSVPPLTYVLGRNKKGGDYALLEERAGYAHHITIMAAHSINGFLEHWLHDEAAVLTGNIVTSPAHFYLDSFPHIYIEVRLGAAASTAFAPVVSEFPEIWTTDHRGDGLATVYMRVASTTAENLQTVYPSGMPAHTAIVEGHNAIYDPRTGNYGYSENIALFRLWHLTSPVGGKLTLDDMYLPDWAGAANVCDELVLNRTGGTEPRYRGGFWFRADNDPVQVGRLMDQAADLVVYERPDGKIGVHPGTFVAPDIRLTENDIISVNYDPNKRQGTTVLAVRGRFTDPSNGYNTTDAAIYGVPYPTDDERTKTVDNQAVQRHNHIARLQKLAYIRANAPRVTVKAHYEAARDVPYRRFVRVHVPPKMDEAIVEVLGPPKTSLRGLTVEFDGIIVPAALYAFNAATEEGAPGSNVTPIEPDDIPVPAGFDVTIETDELAGGDGYYALAAWTPASPDVFTYELQWVPTAGGAVQSVTSTTGASELRTPYIADDVSLKFRLRRWSAGARSDWTGYITRTP